ncbi:unnamed protein product [Closterium sp. NIES-54]
MAVAKRVLRYLCSTSGMGLVLGVRSPVVLTSHADASWVYDLATQRSSQGYTFSLVLYVDNKAMLALCREHRLEHRTKHIALRYFLARELQQRGQLRLAYVASQANTTDIFTKALQPCDHQRFCTMLASTLLKPAGIRYYQRKLGCLLFAAVTCRPDISYSASQLATYLKKPEAEHMLELNRALHYLVSTPTIGLTYDKTGTTIPKLIGYVDADHAGDSDNIQSRTGYVYRLEPTGPISWQSNKQELIALSSAVA